MYEIVNIQCVNVTYILYIDISDRYINFLKRIVTRKRGLFMNQHAVKFRTYPKLRGRMSEYGYTNRTLGAAIGITSGSFGNKLVCRAPWTLPEVYAIMQALDLSITEIETYFPPDESRRKAT